MGLTSATVGFNPAQLSAGVGERLICIAVARDGATNFAVTPNAGGASWVNRVAEATLPGNDTARRSLAIAELVPTSAVTDVTFTATWSGGDGGSTDTIWLRVEEGADWEFAAAAVADSGTGTVTILGTGSTAAVAAGDVLAVAGATIRSGGTNPAAWTTTDINPALVGGGNALLDRYAGAGEGGNASAAGYLSAADQPGQAWSDTLTIDTARMCTVALAVWVAASGAEPVAGSGVGFGGGFGQASPAKLGTGTATGAGGGFSAASPAKVGAGPATGYGGGHGSAAPAKVGLGSTSGEGGGFGEATATKLGGGSGQGPGGGYSRAQVTTIRRTRATGFGGGMGRSRVSRTAAGSGTGFGGGYGAHRPTVVVVPGILTPGSTRPTLTPGTTRPALTAGATRPVLTPGRLPDG